MFKYKEGFQEYTCTVKQGEVTVEPSDARSYVENLATDVKAMYYTPNDEMLLLYLSESLKGDYEYTPAVTEEDLVY